MFAVDKILHPTDFSEPAERALEAAVALAEKFSAELVLVHVIAPPMSPGGAGNVIGVPAEGFRMPMLMRELEPRAREAIRKLVAERIPAHLTPRSHILFGQAAEEISGLADKEGADLIVMATHGQSGWGKILFGSVAERVVRLAECPVLTVKPPKDQS
jgi:nucleotide-binding universal stress UspA family protein